MITASEVSKKPGAVHFTILRLGSNGRFLRCARTLRIRYLHRSAGCDLGWPPLKSMILIAHTRRPRLFDFDTGLTEYTIALSEILKRVEVQRDGFCDVLQGLILGVTTTRCAKFDTERSECSTVRIYFHVQDYGLHVLPSPPL